MKQMTFLDLCSGIGGFRLGLETAGHKCIGYCEYDKFARASYEAMYDTEGEWKAHDVTKLKPGDVPYADIWCFGFPCQDISVAGKQRGLVGKRSGIYYNIIDLLKGKEESAKPSYLLVENVKNLLSINAGFDFASVLSEMDEAGYDCRWQVLNSKNFGVPQNRERVFIIANLRSRGRREILPLTGENAAALNQLIGGMQGYRVYGTDGISATLVGNAGGVGAKTGLYFIDQSNHDPKITDTARCLTARYTPGMTNHSAMNSAVLEVHPVLTPERMEKRQNGRRFKECGEPSFCVTTQDRNGVYLCACSSCEKARPAKNGVPNCDNNLLLALCNENIPFFGCGRIRRLTPRECWRLQGFTDNMFDKAAEVNSDNQLYKQAGNGVTVTVVYSVGQRIVEIENELKILDKE